MSDILVDPAHRYRGLVVVADVTHQLARKVCYAALAELGLELELSGGRPGAWSNEGPNGSCSPNQSS
jgi:hypothetical protein